MPGIVFKKISAPLLPPPKASAASFFLPKTPFPQRVRDPIFPNPFPNPPTTNLLKVPPTTPNVLKYTKPQPGPKALHLSTTRLSKPSNPVDRPSSSSQPLPPPPPSTTTTSIHNHHHYVNPTAATVCSSFEETQRPQGLSNRLACWVWLIQRRAITCNGHSPQ